MEDTGGAFAPVDLGKRCGQLIYPHQADGVRGIGGLARPLTLPPIARRLGLRQFASMSFLGGLEQVGANFLRIHRCDLLKICVNSLEGKPAASAQDRQTNQYGNSGVSQSALPTLLRKA